MSKIVRRAFYAAVGFEKGYSGIYDAIMWALKVKTGRVCGRGSRQVEVGNYWR